MNPSQNIDNSVLDSFVVDVWDTHHGAIQFWHVKGALRWPKSLPMARQ